MAKWMPYNEHANRKEAIMKMGLNKMDISKFHKMLKQKIPLKAIAKKLHTSVEVLKKFTPERVAAATKRAKGIENAAVAASSARHETVKAAVAGAVSATTPPTPPPVVREPEVATESAPTTDEDLGI